MPPGLGFIWLALEEFNTESRQVACAALGCSRCRGALLYRLDTDPCCRECGFVTLAGRISLYYWRGLAGTEPEGLPNVGLMTAICKVLAYLLEPMSFTRPHWVAIGVTLVAVLLLTARENLHRATRRPEVSDIVTAGKLLLIGLALRLLPSAPVTTLSLPPCSARSRSPRC